VVHLLLLLLLLPSVKLNRLLPTLLRQVILIPKPTQYSSLPPMPGSLSDSLPLFPTKLPFKD
jgi:hypothetical protein